jgi:hypothetical protein
MALGLKRNPIADLEVEHLSVRPHLTQESEPRDDSVVQVDQLCLGQPVDVDLHALCFTAS